MTSQVKVLIVDDTITYRQILSKVVDLMDGVELVGTASSGKTALMKLAALQPDLVLLDVMMPEMDGVETLQNIKAENADIQVVMISAFNMEHAKATLKSLEHGALDFLPKPNVSSPSEGISLLSESLAPLVDIVRKKIKRKDEPVSQEKPKEKVSEQLIVSDGKIDLLAMGSSTGGPNALNQVVSDLSPSMNCPILLVQHMPPLFTQSLAERLNKVTHYEVKEGEENETVVPGKMYIAPGDKHMIVREIKENGDSVMKIGLNDSPPVNHCRPAVDVLFRSVAGVAGDRVLSVILTGMGRDGTEGVKVLRRKGAKCLVQDEATSVVWGMPGSVYEAGLADEVLPLEQVGKRISKIIEESGG